MAINHLLNMKYLYLLFLSMQALASFETTQTSVILTNSSLTKEIVFTNNSETTKTINFEVFTNSSKTQNSSLFSVALNRCLNVKPLKKCNAVIKFNSKNLIGSELGTAYDSYLSYDNSGIPLQGLVISQSLNNSVTVDVSSINFLIDPNLKRSQSKSIIFTNQGSDVFPSINLSNSNNFKILVNRCNKVLKKGNNCQISIIYEPKESNSSNSTISIAGIVIPISGQKNQELAITGDSSIANLSVEVLTPISYTQSLTQGSNVSWSLSGSYPLGMTISNSGQLSLIPTLIQVGTYSFNIIAQNSLNVFSKPVSLKVKPKIQISSLNFTEGFIGNNLIILNLQSGVQINNIVFQNLNEFLTPLRVKKNGNTIDNFERLSLDSSGNTISVQSLTTGLSSIEITIDGGIKYQANSSLSLTIQTSIGDFAYSYPINISGQLLPYVKYDVFAAKGNGTITGDRPDQILINSDVFRSVSLGWRTPILTKYRVQEINCAGSIIDDYYGDNSNHENCVSQRVDPDSETVFWFRRTYSSANNAIGGRAQGVRHGVVVESVPWFYTLAHELGHNLGLFHTFESAANFSVSHKDSSDIFPIQRSMYNSITNRGVFFDGDWLPYLFDFTSSFGVIDFIYNGTNDTAIDYYSSKKKSLYNNLEGCVFGCNYPNDPFRNGDQVFLGYDLQDDFNGRSSGYACELSSYNSLTKTWTTNCDASASLSQNTINNVMSYWYKYHDGNTSFTTNQKLRMDSVLTYPSYQFLGVKQ